MQAEALLETYGGKADQRLQMLLPPDFREPEQLHAAMRHSCLAPGKRLRPALCIASAEAVGEAGSAVLDAACAIEMVHCFSLIHDDLPAIDDDDMRRGRPSCHIEFGEALAILAGDALFALAFDTLASVEGSEPKKVLRAVQVLAQAAGSDGLVGGEVADVLSEGKKPEPATVAFIHSRKTGALISASCEIGGLLGGGSETEIECLRDFGQEIGLAFQIADDLLNELSTAETLGKSAGSDRARQKATYPALYGVEDSRQAAFEAVERGLACIEGLHADRAKLAALGRYAVERLR